MRGTVAKRLRKLCKQALPGDRSPRQRTHYWVRTRDARHTPTDYTMVCDPLRRAYKALKRTHTRHEG